MNRLQDKVALVTGAARGLGLAIARRFRAEGAAIVVNDLDAGAAEKAAAPLGGIGVAADVSDPAAVARMFERVRREHGRLDVLVNNAGINGIEGDDERAQRFRERTLAQVMEASSGGPIRTHIDITLETTDAEWRRMLGVHLDGTFYCTREALAIMGPQGSGNVINMASVVGITGVAGAAAKGGILGFTRAVAREVVSRGIRVNAIAPGWIETDMTAFLGESRRLIEMQTPMHRLGDADDIAWAAVYLASEEAKFVTGQVLSPNGGWVMNQ